MGLVQFGWITASVLALVLPYLYWFLMENL